MILRAPYSLPVTKFNGLSKSELLREADQLRTQARPVVLGYGQVNDELGSLAHLLEELCQRLE